MRRLLVALLLAACASAPRIDEPLFLDFRWVPAPTDATVAPGREKDIASRQEMLALLFRNQFDTRFSNVHLDHRGDAAARVTVTVTETTRPAYADRMKVRGSQGVRAADQRCGTAEHIVYRDGRAITRGEIPLDCDGAGRPDYQRAALRLADETAKALTLPDARSR